MTLRLRGGILWLSVCLLGPVASYAQEDPIQQRQAYIAAGGAVLTAYEKEQRSWNHYFTTVAPQQNAGEQIKQQESYRRFLEDTLTKWRQITVIPICHSSHMLYELALYSYSIAADFHLTVLYAKSALFVQKAMELAEERARYYTSQGDEYFKRAVLLAQVDGCVSLPLK